MNNPVTKEKRNKPKSKSLPVSEDIVITDSSADANQLNLFSVNTDTTETLQHDTTNPAADPETSELSDKEYLKREMARRNLARKSYKRYLYYVHGASWRRTHLSDFLADTVQRFVEEQTGNAYDILVIETPPQHGKSMTVTESFPSWYLGKNPKHRIIEASYNKDTAMRFGRKNLEKVEQYGGVVFGLKPGSIWTTTDFELDNGWGRMLSRGIMSGITGNPANLMLIDDPIKNREEADSDTYREKLWEEWQNSLKSRLAAGAKVIIIMTPWHEDDFAARILKTEEHVTLLRIPVEAEENDPLGRSVGDALCPELGKDNVWLQQFKTSYLNDPLQGGMRAWTALYQCSPRVEGGNILHRDWWRYYDPSDEQNQYFPTEVISVDAAFKDSESNDFVAISVVGKRGTDVYVEYVLNKHLDFTETCNAIRQIKRLYPRASRVLIEDKANGSAIINVLQREMFCIPVNPRGGKVSRVNAVSAAVESGHVFLPKDAAWVGEFLDQATSFPAAAHDDMVDSFTQATSYLLFMNGGLESGETEEERQIRLLEEEASVVFLNSDMYSVYDRPEDEIYAF